MVTMRKWFPSRADIRREMETALESAQNEADKGNPDTMQAFLDEASEKANMLREDIRDRVKTIRQTGYEKALQVELEQADNFAQTGNTRMADLHLKIAETHAAELGNVAMERVERERSRLGVPTSD